MTWEGLHNYLFKGLTNDIQKVRALFMWAGTRKLLYPYGIHYRLEAPDSSPHVLLKELTGNFSFLALAKFFAHLCRSANLPCVVLHGKFKSRTSFGDDIWNAVHVEGSWSLVQTSDAYVRCIGSDGWTLIEDSGNPERTRSLFVGVVLKQFSPDEDSFLMDPELSIHNNFPLKDNAWQLIPEPWSLEAFMTTPKFYEAYLHSSWHLADKHKLFEEAAGGRCRITFDKMPEKSRGIKYQLFFNEEKSKGNLPKDLQLTNYVITEKTMTTQSFAIRLPVVGIYEIRMFDNDMNNLCDMGLKCTGKIGKQKPFPDIPEKGFGFSQEAVDSGLVNASREEGLVVAREGEKVRFKFRTSQPLDVQARLVHRFLQSQELESRVTQEEDGNTVTVTVKVPYHAQNPEFTLQVNAKTKDSEADFMNVLNYLLTPDKQLVYSDKGQAKQVSDELSAALKDDDIDRLESAVRQFHAGSDANSDSDILSQAYTKLKSLHTTAIKNAVASKNIDKIEATLNEANASAVAYYIHQSDVFQQAQDTLRRLRRLASVRHEVKELSGSQVSEVQSYNHPHPGVRDTVVATFVLLGENDKKLKKKWNVVQSLLRSHGKQNILYRIQSYDATKDVDPKRLESAAALLAKITAEEVRSLSIGVAAFYNWSKAVVDSALEENNEEPVNP
ncbi:hillarin-like isoform X2 [Littorina saxatilis]